MKSAAAALQLMVWALIAVLSVWWVRHHTIRTAQQEYPNQPIQVVVPFPAGGGTDTFVRILQQGIVEDQLLSQPLVVINQGGGGGTIGSRTVKNARADGYKILCLHNGMITAKLAGTVPYGPEAFEPIALTGAMTLLIIVREDAPYQDVNDLLRQAKETPNAICFGASQGSPAYFATLQLERSLPGASFNIVSSKGGSDRYAGLIGGHIHAGIFSLSEYLDFLSAEGTPADQNIRAIAVLGQTRHEAIPDVPTCQEQGVPVLLSNYNYWWAPQGTPRPIISRLAEVLDRTLHNKTVRSELARLRLDPDYMTGAPLLRHLSETEATFASVASVKQSTVPDFVPWLAAVTGIFLLWSVVESRQLHTKERPAGNLQHRQTRIAFACFTVLAVYVVVLDSGWCPFAAITSLMVFVVGLLMTRFQRSHWMILAQIALSTGLGLEYVFTQIFVTALP